MHFLCTENFSRHHFGSNGLSHVFLEALLLFFIKLNLYWRYRLWKNWKFFKKINWTDLLLTILKNSNSILEYETDISIKNLSKISVTLLKIDNNVYSYINDPCTNHQKRTWKYRRPLQGNNLYFSNNKKKLDIFLELAILRLHREQLKPI